MAANQVDFKILPSDQFSVYSPQTRSDKVITYFTLLSKLRGDILSVGQEDDPNNIVSAFYINTGNVQTLHLVKADGSEVTASNSFAGTVTSVDMSVPTGFSISGNPITTSGTLAVGFASGYSLPTNAIQATWTTAYNRSLTSAAVTGTSTKTLTLNQQNGGTITASWSDIDTGLTSVGLTMPAAFSVANSPLTANGTLAVTAAGLSSQYIRGDGQLANFPTPGGGGSSVNYYLNGSVSQGTFGGDTYYELSKTPIAGAGTNFTRTSASGNGYVASFITDANDPDLINIPGGNWNLEFYFNSSSSGGSPAFYGELYKVSVSNVFTLIASGSANSEVISGGTAVDQYYTSIAVPQTALLATDRLAIRVYVIVDGRNITLHTENSNFSEVITTFSTGLNSLNGLSDQVQYFAVGTSGTDFAISSSVDTHTFNLPTASATNRGALSSADWTTFNGKASDAFKTIAVTGQSDIVADNATDTLNIVAGSGVTLTTNATTDTLTISATGSGGTVTSVDLTAGTGISVSGGPITGSGSITVNNTAPDQTVVLTGGTGITTSGTYPSFTVTNSDRGSSQNIFKNIAVAGQSTIIADVNDDTLTVVAGSGVTITTNDTTDTITISATGSGGSVTSVATTAPITGGTITTTGTIGITQSGAAADGYLSSTDWNTFNNKQNALTNPVTGTGTTNYVPKWTSSSAIGNSAIYDNAGNIGIGETAPASVLTVRKDSATGRGGEISIINYGGTGAGASAALNFGLEASTYDADSGNAQIKAILTGGSGITDMVFSSWTGAAFTEKIRILSGGNVGINTTAPGQKLQVDGNLLVNAGTSAAAYRDIMIGGIGGWATGESHGIDAVYSTAASPTTFSRIESHFDGTNGKMRFRNLFNASAPRTDILMTIQGNGNVGIGTDDPSYKLDVDSGSSQIAARFYNSSNVSTVVYIGDTGNSDFSDLILQSNSGTGEIFKVGTVYSSYGGTLSLNIYNSNGAIAFHPNNTANAMFIATDTKVGIGNTGPSEKLHVTGNIRVTGAYYDSANAAGTSGQILSSTGTGTSWIAAPSGGITGSGTTNYVPKWTSASAIGDSAIYDNAGNIGINTTAPKTKLDINGTIGFGSKSMSITDTFATALTINMADHSGCYVKITAFGDWGNHSAIAYLGEFFLQASAGGYNEPGMIIRQVDNTATDDIQAQIVDPVGTGTRNFEIQLKATSSSFTPFTAYLQYEVRGQYNSVS